MGNAPNINAIPTEYQGVTFRSRTEARWAVFFNHLGVRWQYEPEGYQLGDGTWYLPDFWLPDMEWFVEVKPDTGMGVEKARGLAETAKKAVAITHGPPSEDAFPLRAWTWDRAAESVYEIESGVIPIKVSDNPHTNWFFITMRTALASKHFTYLVRIAYASHEAMTYSFWNPSVKTEVVIRPTSKQVTNKTIAEVGSSLLDRVRGGGSSDDGKNTYAADRVISGLTSEGYRVAAIRSNGNVRISRTDASQGAPDEETMRAVSQFKPSVFAELVRRGMVVEA